MQMQGFLLYGDDDNHNDDNHGVNDENDGSSLIQVNDPEVKM